MKRTNALSGEKNLIDNISFDENDDVNRACQAIQKSDLEFMPPFGCLIGYTSGCDVDTGDILVFIPKYSLIGLSKDDEKRLFDIMNRRLTEQGFEVIEEVDKGGDEFFHIGFASHFFRLKKIK